MKKILSGLVLLIVMLMTPAAECRAQNSKSPDSEGDKPKAETVRRMLKMTGAANISSQLCDVLFDSYKRMRPDIPAEIWQELRQEFERDFTEESFVEMLTPIYARYFTESDLQQILAFYESPAGKKVLTSLPALMNDSMEAGKLRGLKAGERLKERLAEKGYKVPTT